MPTTFNLLGQEISLLETIAFLTGLSGVALTVRKHILNFPIGILNVLLYAWLFLQPDVRLYADALLQLIFAVLLMYGWMSWHKSPDSTQAPPALTAAQWKRLLLVTLAGWIVLGSVLSACTAATLPWLDAALTAVSLTAQWMVAKKNRENWLLWITVNAVYVPLYFFKHLPLTALLYVLFLILALRGWKTWKGTRQ